METVFDEKWGNWMLIEEPAEYLRRDGEIMFPQIRFEATLSTNRRFITIRWWDLFAVNVDSDGRITGIQVPEWGTHGTHQSWKSYGTLKNPVTAGLLGKVKYDRPTEKDLWAWHTVLFDFLMEAYFDDMWRFKNRFACAEWLLKNWNSQA